MTTKNVIRHYAVINASQDVSSFFKTFIGTFLSND